MVGFLLKLLFIYHFECNINYYFVNNIHIYLLKRGKNGDIIYILC